METQKIDIQAVELYIKLLKKLNVATRLAIIQGLFPSLAEGKSENHKLLISLCGSWEGEDAEEIAQNVYNTRTFNREITTWE